MITQSDAAFGLILMSTHTWKNCYKSKKLTQRITPQCYGAFGSKQLDILKDLRHHFSRAKYLLVFKRCLFIFQITGVSPNDLRTKAGGLP